ncbi:MAG: DUF5058 family protein [Clostridia bacterium]|nr:DUF5058 family protein [Clostridia bacterium]MBQ4637793.1 DUF5058 family protein [Clostridia bacterium]
MEFSVNSPVLFVLAGVIIAAVLGQSVYFLVKAFRRGLELNMSKEKLMRIMISSAIFTIAPAVAIIISVITLSKDLGLPLPWLRLSVVGSLSYETIAAANAESAMGLTFGQAVSLNASQYVTIASVMTLSIMVGIWLVPVVCKKMQGGMINLEKRDKKWADVLSNSMFIGMIAAFVGYVFCDVSTVLEGDASGLIPVCVTLVSAAVMALSGLLVNKPKFKWVNDYALPVSLIIGMASAIPITAWLG